MPQDLSIELLNKKIQIVKIWREILFRWCTSAHYRESSMADDFYRFDDLLHNIQFIKSEWMYGVAKVSPF